MKSVPHPATPRLNAKRTMRPPCFAETPRFPLGAGMPRDDSTEWVISLARHLPAPQEPRSRPLSTMPTIPTKSTIRRRSLRRSFLRPACRASSCRHSRHRRYCRLRARGAAFVRPCPLPRSAVSATMPPWKTQAENSSRNPLGAIDVLIRSRWQPSFKWKHGGSARRSLTFETTPRAAGSTR